MANTDGPGGTGSTGPGRKDVHPDDGDLDRRRRVLEEALAARKPIVQEEGDGRSKGGMAGFGYALRLSSEFIAAVIVGAVIGWTIDQVAGTTPWGLVVFLLLGFVAGVLNVLRSACLVAENIPVRRDERKDRDGN